jgi:hypothetical protein
VIAVAHRRRNELAGHLVSHFAAQAASGPGHQRIVTSLARGR